MGGVRARVSVIACVGHVAYVIPAVGSAGATLREGDPRGYVLVGRSGVTVVGPLGELAVVALAAQAGAEPANLCLPVVAIVDYHLEPLRERLYFVSVDACCALLVVGVYLRAAGPSTVAQLQVGYPVAAVVAAVRWVHRAVLETAGGATSSEIAYAAV